MSTESLVEIEDRIDTGLRRAFFPIFPNFLKKVEIEDRIDTGLRQSYFRDPPKWVIKWKSKTGLIRD